MGASLKIGLRNLSIRELLFTILYHIEAGLCLINLVLSMRISLL